MFTVLLTSQFNDNDDNEDDKQSAEYFDEDAVDHLENEEPDGSISQGETNQRRL